VKETTVRNTILSALSFIACGFSTSCSIGADDFKPEAIIGMERAALDRWGKGDPQGYLEIYALEVTYFDPALDKRLNGLDAMRKYLEPITGKIQVDRYDMIDPKVQRHGDVAALSYNLISYGKKPDGRETVLARWNSAKIYERIGGQWKILHDHWSYIKPDLRQRSGE
jgi:ketosteroid isomerase-like protein